MTRLKNSNVGPWSELANHTFEMGPLKKAGKVFLSELLGTTGAEISLNRLEAGDSYQFLHRHRTHEEIYVIVSGRGDFLIDGEQIAVQEGSAIRMAPHAVRTVRASADESLCYLCIQAVDGTLKSRTVTDGELVSGEVIWR